VVEKIQSWNLYIHKKKRQTKGGRKIEFKNENATTSSNGGLLKPTAVSPPTPWVMLQGRSVAVVLARNNTVKKCFGLNQNCFMLINEKIVLFG